MPERETSANVDHAAPGFNSWAPYDHDTHASVADLINATKGAREATEAEHRLTTWESAKLYPRAILCSVILSFAIIMEGYDTALLGNFYALPQFRQRFGSHLQDGDWQVLSSWQTSLQNGANVGQIIGLLTAGILADRYGYKPTMIASLMMISGAIFVLFFAKNVAMLLAGEILCGIPLGAFQSLTTTYAADVTPMALRPILTSFVNLCWVFGQFIAAGVLKGVLIRQDQWAYRLPFAIQWIWPLPIAIGILLLAPESPWWLIRHGKIDRAHDALRLLASRAVSDDLINENLQLMILTNEHERQLVEGTSYRECFTGTNFRRTEITCLTWVIQVSCGIWFGGNIVYFLEQAGFDSNKSFNFGLGMNAVAVVGTVSSWFLMPRVGRRKLYMCGLITLFSCLLVVGFLGIPTPTSALGSASAAFLFMFVFTYDLTVGPVCYCLVSEIPSTRLRVKTVVLARNAYNIASICANFLNPPILNPSSWDLRGKGGFIWASTCFISLVWAYFRLPEPKGRTPAEMDLLFETKVKSREFRTAPADLFNSYN